MSNTDLEIVVDDPTAPEENSPTVVSTGFVDIVVSLLLLALALVLGWDNWRTGASWDSTGPPPVYCRVMAVFAPTFLFCLATQYLGLYVASFLLIAGFMRVVGKIALWKSLLTAFIFTAAMFVTFDIAFDVIMPKGPLEAAFGY
mgnify:CR=1 FL=1